MNNHDKCIEDKIYTAVRAMFGYGEEGDEVIDWLMDNSK